MCDFAAVQTIEYYFTKRLSSKSIKTVQPPRQATVQTAAGAPYLWFAAFASAPYSRSSRTIDSWTSNTASTRIVVPLNNRRLRSAYQVNQSKQCSPRAQPQSKQQRARLTHGLLRSRQHRAPEAAAPSTRGLQMQPPRELWFP